MSTQTGTSSEMLGSQWEVDKVILPAELLSINGDELYSVYFTSLVLSHLLNSWRNNYPSGKFFIALGLVKGKAFYDD